MGEGKGTSLPGAQRESCSSHLESSQRTPCPCLTLFAPLPLPGGSHCYPVNLVLPGPLREEDCTSKGSFFLWSRESSPSSPHVPSLAGTASPFRVVAEGTHGCTLPFFFRAFSYCCAPPPRRPSPGPPPPPPWPRPPAPLQGVQADPIEYFRKSSKQSGGWSP